MMCVVLSHGFQLPHAFSIFLEVCAGLIGFAWCLWVLGLVCTIICKLLGRRPPSVDSKSTSGQMDEFLHALSHNWTVAFSIVLIGFVANFFPPSSLIHTCIIILNDGFMAIGSFAIVIWVLYFLFMSIMNLYAWSFLLFASPSRRF